MVLSPPLPPLPPTTLQQPTSARVKPRSSSPTDPTPPLAYSHFKMGHRDSTCSRGGEWGLGGLNSSDKTRGWGEVELEKESFEHYEEDEEECALLRPVDAWILLRSFDFPLFEPSRSRLPTLLLLLLVLVTALFLGYTVLLTVVAFHSLLLSLAQLNGPGTGGDVWLAEMVRFVLVLRFEVFLGATLGLALTTALFLMILLLVPRSLASAQQLALFLLLPISLSMLIHLGLATSNMILTHKISHLFWLDSMDQSTACDDQRWTTWDVAWVVAAECGLNGERDGRKLQNWAAARLSATFIFLMGWVLLLLVCTQDRPTPQKLLPPTPTSTPTLAKSVQPDGELPSFLNISMSFDENVKTTYSASAQRKVGKNLAWREVLGTIFGAGRSVEAPVIIVEVDQEEGEETEEKKWNEGKVLRKKRRRQEGCARQSARRKSNATREVEGEDQSIFLPLLLTSSSSPVLPELTFLSPSLIPIPSPQLESTFVVIHPAPILRSIPETLAPTSTSRTPSFVSPTLPVSPSAALMRPPFVHTVTSRPPMVAAISLPLLPPPTHQLPVLAPHLPRPLSTSSSSHQNRHRHSRSNSSITSHSRTSSNSCAHSSDSNSTTKSGKWNSSNGTGSSNGFRPDFSLARALSESDLERGRREGTQLRPKIFVKMSDGRLVRRLSTIRSDASGEVGRAGMTSDEGELLNDLGEEETEDEDDEGDEYLDSLTSTTSKALLKAITLAQRVQLVQLASTGGSAVKEGGV